MVWYPCYVLPFLGVNPFNLFLFVNYILRFLPWFCFRWLPDHVTLLARFVSEPSPVKSTVTKAVAEFRRTHADTWSIQKDAFSEEQLEVITTILSLFGVLAVASSFFFENLAVQPRVSFDRAENRTQKDVFHSSQ
jgi:Domain of unknown function (DUF3437)